ncbi:8-amino-7-oxononanoate synthase [Pasteurella langaaensis DSM 22999]|uniref:8-amino-7-ketopelargonate synthase n=1 Tax=Alitibacter langaaensis DSM 22999 TaxID=1122935 RepID=A0A2U0TCQ1_9PAST|nr:8-amino-7-oxononanoate synthase [Pasteurella langaaensis]PVX41382.1 8-amino-7-oxononanoate synthase [Pasteurella langaaensis DSM 22999]
MTLKFFTETLEQLQQQGQFRQIPHLQHQGKWIVRDGRKMLNMSSNDYLGLASNDLLQQQFLQKFAENLPHFTSSSSRLLTGSFEIYSQFEQLLAQRFQRQAALLFNSGYHANIGILPAVANKKTLIVADKLVHASLIDGIRLSEAEFVRYRHNDMQHLADILAKKHRTFERIIIVTESVFSMDGDCADLSALIAFKCQFDNVMLYVDEAHAIGVLGETGLGLAEQLGCIADIDFLVGTFGKALASMGAYLVCEQVIRDYLVNKMRPLIFSTALPPFNVAWSYFLFDQLHALTQPRQHLAQLSQHLRQALVDMQCEMPSSTHIVPYILGDNHLTVKTAQHLQQQGYYCLPIRPPTVPKGTSRIRLSLTADMTAEELEQFIDCLRREIK